MLPNMSVAPVVIVAVYRVEGVTTSGLDGVSVKVVFVESAVMGPDTPGATVNVVELMVAGFIGLLNVAEIRVLGHGPEAPAGRTEITVGGVNWSPGFDAFGFLSASPPHPATKTASKNAEIQILLTFNLRISFPSSAGDTASETTNHNRDIYYRALFILATLQCLSNIEHW